MKTRKYLSLVLISLLWLGCGQSGENAESTEHEELAPNVVEMNDAQYKEAGIELGTFSRQLMGNEIKVNGLVSVPPQQSVSVSAMLGGYIRSTGMIAGMPVSKGQVLAVIENPEFIELQENYLETKSRYEFAEAEYNRQKELFQSSVNSSKTYQQAVAEYKSSRSKMFALEQKLQLIGINPQNLKEEKITSAVSLTAPISGYITAVNVNIGKYVNPTDVLFEIVNTGNLSLELSVFEDKIASVREGQPITFSLPDKGSEMMMATVSQVGKAIENDKTVKVYAKADKEYRSLLPGMYVNALIHAGEDSTTALPDEAVLTFEDRNFIFVYSERKQEGDKFVTLFQMVEVQAGQSSGGFTAVKFPDGFDAAAAKIVIKGAYKLLSALKNAGDMAC
jgi:cobalt-zinc-cadmium efflux system membrane fusion protein